MGTLGEERACEKSVSTAEESESESMVVVKRVVLIGGSGNGLYHSYLLKVSSSGRDNHLQGQGQGQGQGEGEQEEGCGKNKKKKKVRRRPQTRKLESLWRSWRGDLVSFARIGSTMYCVGGGPSDTIPTSNVYVADMDMDMDMDMYNNNKLKWWKKIPSMLIKRLSPETVVVNDKLYVFGGFYIPRDTTPTDPWGEVYDPKKRTWRSLPQPPSFFDKTSGMFVVHDHSSSSSSSSSSLSLLKTKILMGSAYFPYLFAYDVVTDTWETIADDFYSFSGVTRPVLRHNKLYWIAHRIAVYDLHLKRMFTGPIIGKFDAALLYTPSDIYYKLVVFHIDRDEFCCIWMDGTVEGPLEHLQPVCCTTIRISEPLYKNGGKHSVKGHCLFTQHYLVDQEQLFPLFGLVLDRTFSAIDEGEKKQEESACGQLGEVNRRMMSLAVA